MQILGSTILVKAFLTGILSSRMRTARSLTVSFSSYQGRGHVCHACTSPNMHASYHACPPAMHTPTMHVPHTPNHTPPAMHTPCHTHLLIMHAPLSHMPAPVMHAAPATHTPLPHMLPLPCTPPVDRQTYL